MQHAWHVINLNTDNSIIEQPETRSLVAQTVDLTNHCPDLRLWANRRGIQVLEDTLSRLRQVLTPPWLTFLGSGDFHHMTYFLLKSLRPKPTTVILVDNHPDWYQLPPRFHCGNWVSSVLQLPWVERVIMIGQDSDDLSGGQFWFTPTRAMAQGRVQLYPYRRSVSKIPLQWLPKPHPEAPYHIQRKLWGSEIRYEPLSAMPWANFLDKLTQSLPDGTRVYLSIDKDCLRPEDAQTDWDQGQLSITALADLIRHLNDHTQLCGMDICGEQAPESLEGFIKRWEAGRLFGAKPDYTLTPAWAQNQQTNLLILQALGLVPNRLEAAVGL